VVPPLRHRHVDLADLSNHFLALHAPPGLGIQLSLPARTKLASHSFPGNVRELRNIIQRALLLRTGNIIMPRDISFDAPYREAPSASGKTESARIDTDDCLLLPGRTLKQCTDEIVLRAVRRHSNKTASANELGISRTTVVKLMKLAAQTGVPT
jgi:DNA-binding NtrC family response regulator